MGEAETTADPAQAEPLATLERARQGDRGAFEELMRLHLPRVWRTVWQIVRHEQDCEDVVQEVFLTAWQSLPSFRGDARFSTWLHTIAVTRSLNHLDRASEKLRRVSRPLETALPDSEDEAPEIAPAVEAAAAQQGYGKDPTPLQELEASELMRRLSRCLERLPAAWRAILTMRDGEDASYKDIADTLGLALGTVRSRIARARLSLRECVEGRSS